MEWNVVKATSVSAFWTTDGDMYISERREMMDFDDTRLCVINVHLVRLTSIVESTFPPRLCGW